uniref:14-3-3 protein gamma n=1 Tax=Ackermannviridae sp. TaxID=2831612 RepID=A0A8S5VY01_9CAUD|nr:MAG TPA: 14-3-3 protein gamma [Ackermannviridae sp.]
MDVLEYEKARIRMCRTMILEKGGCEACPLYNALKRKCGFAASIIPNPDIDTIKNNVDRVIKWSKDHPVKTRKSEFLKMFPKAEIKDDAIWMCPKYISYDYRPEENCREISCGDCKRKFWLTEVTE